MVNFKAYSSKITGLERYKNKSLGSNTKIKLSTNGENEAGVRFLSSNVQ